MNELEEGYENRFFEEQQYGALIKILQDHYGERMKALIFKRISRLSLLLYIAPQSAVEAKTTRKVEILRCCNAYSKLHLIKTE